MGEPAKKLEKLPDVSAPDGSKPISLEYWYLPYNLGAHTQHQIVVNGHVYDGCGVSGLCKSLTLYPNGVVVAEIQVGFVPGRLESEQRVELTHLVLTHGHGKVKR